MKYKVNPAVWSSMFAIPTSIVDEHIRLAGSAQLKVLLWIFRHASEDFDIDDISKALGLNSGDVSDAMQYWIECKILSEDGEMVKPKAIAKKAGNESESTANPKTPERKVLATIGELKPSIDQIANRLSESDELRLLFSEAQTRLGRTIGYDGQATLLMMHDQYGLPTEVIIMIIEYAVSIGKSSNGYIAKVGKDWGEREIDTLEKADEEIERLKTSNELWKKLCEMTGIKNPRPTSSQIKYLVDWTKNLSFDIDMIFAAYEEMANNTEKLSFPYIDKVLKNWHSKGVKTLDDVQKEKLEFIDMKNKKKKAKAGAIQSEASYDLNAFREQSLNEPLVYRKGKK